MENYSSFFFIGYYIIAILLFISGFPREELAHMSSLSRYLTIFIAINIGPLFILTAYAYYAYYFLKKKFF